MARGATDHPLLRVGKEGKRGKEGHASSFIREIARR